MIKSAFFAVLLTASALFAQTANVTVVHGIPGLPEPVEVFANGNKLFAFDYGETKGPLALPPGDYDLEVKLQGGTVLSATAPVEAGGDYTVIAHLKESEGIALALFANDNSPLDNDRNARVTVRHLADAPAVDVLARRWWFTKQLFGNVSNGQEGTTEVYNGSYAVSLNAAGTHVTAFGPAKVTFERGKIYAIHAIGDLADGNFQLFTQVVEPGSADGDLVGMVRGSSCGGSIGLSTTTPQYGESIEVTLSGAEGDWGLLHIGASDSRLGFLRLPLDLGLLGAEGCSLYQSTEHIQMIKIDAMGNSSVAFKIPAAMDGFDEIHFQFSHPTSSNKLGLALSDYASIEAN